MQVVQKKFQECYVVVLAEHTMEYRHRVSIDEIIVGPVHGIQQTPDKGLRDQRLRLVAGHDLFKDPVLVGVGFRCLGLEVYMQVDLMLKVICREHRCGW